MHASLSSDDERGNVADCSPALAEVSRNLFGISVVGIRCQTVMGATRVAAEATR
jgi:glutaminase